MVKCLKCKRVVKKNEHQVVISTLNRATKPDDYVYFHFKCWSDFFQESVNNKARAEVEKMRLVAFNLLENPMIRSVVEKIGGGEQLSAILNKPLVPPQVIQITPVKQINKKEVAKRIEDDRKKRARKTKRRSK